MPLKRLPYASLDDLIKDYLSIEEDPVTKALIKKLKVAKKRGFLLKKELISICYWKSARAIRLIESNPSQTIKAITQSAFSSKNETDRMESLKRLRGVGIPMASSILMLTNPVHYGVIDIRAWEVLYKMEAVFTNPNGVNFRIKEWVAYIKIIRMLSKKHKVSAREIENTFFAVHLDYQDGSLYRNLV